MAKPPFSYKPSRSSPKGDKQQVQLDGTAEVLATYSDVFVVTNEGGTGIASLYFYQRQIGDREVSLGTTDTGIRVPRAKCVSRIAMAPQAAQTLLEAFAKNRGYTLTQETKERKQCL